MTADDRWWRFQIQLSNFTARDCKDDSVRIADAAGVVARGVNAENRRIRMTHVQDCLLDGVALTNGEFVVEGETKPSTTADVRNSGVILRHVSIDNGYLSIRNCKGLTCEGVRISHPVGEAVRTTNNFDCVTNRISVETSSNL